LTNKAAKGKKGAIVAMIAGTKAQTVIAIIEKTLKLRNTVSDITLDMAANMGLIAKRFLIQLASQIDLLLFLF
jgi:hypothetical protein